MEHMVACQRFSLATHQQHLHPASPQNNSEWMSGGSWMTMMERSHDLVLSVAVVQFMRESAGQVSSSSATSTW
jgi:hypothetical protein